MNAGLAIDYKNNGANSHQNKNQSTFLLRRKNTTMGTTRVDNSTINVTYSYRNYHPNLLGRSQYLKKNLISLKMAQKFQIRATNHKDVRWTHPPWWKRPRGVRSAHWLDNDAFAVPCDWLTRICFSEITMRHEWWLTDFADESFAMAKTAPWWFPASLCRTN